MIKKPMNQIDFYKADHRRQYPEGTTLVYSNFTARSSHLSNISSSKDYIVFFGLQYFIKDYLFNSFDKGFFERDRGEVVEEYKRRMDTSLGEGVITCEHIGALHDLGYLPLEIRALPEGSRVPMRVPCLTIHNTHPDFFWLVNYIETIMSCYLWKPCVSATTAEAYRSLLDSAAADTSTQLDFVPFQGHDFSFRGMSGPQDAAMSGAGHLLSFVGTDTVPAIDFLETYYNADATKELVGCSVPATEHSVMCMGSKDNELETYRRLIEDVYPSGIVSIVSDTWDFWKVLTEFLPKLKHSIMDRAGKVVIRPDSGDPVDIICGTGVDDGSNEAKGAMQLLWEEFGGITNCKGYKELDPHIGLIYGDSITPERAKQILQRLRDNGFASTNVVLGIGSFTYQYVTRDTYGFAIKSTYGEICGEGRSIFKDPITDNGVKKSAVGLLAVKDGELLDQQIENKASDLSVVFKDGEIYKDFTLTEIRENLYEKF